MTQSAARTSLGARLSQQLGVWTGFRSDPAAKLEWGCALVARWWADQPGVFLSARTGGSGGSGGPFCSPFGRQQASAARVPAASGVAGRGARNFPDFFRVHNRTRMPPGSPSATSRTLCVWDRPELQPVAHLRTSCSGGAVRCAGGLRPQGAAGGGAGGWPARRRLRPSLGIRAGDSHGSARRRVRKQYC